MRLIGCKIIRSYAVKIYYILYNLLHRINIFGPKLYFLKKEIRNSCVYCFSMILQNDIHTQQSKLDPKFINVYVTWVLKCVLD